TCTQNGKTVTFVPFRDLELLGVLIVYALPLALVIAEFFARPHWPKIAVLALESIGGGYSAYIIYAQVLLRTPTWIFYVLAAALIVYILTAIGAFIHAMRARRSLQLRPMLEQ
ncbi:MAG TPA: hypothetical protein VF787_27955, partial [Thermoanaerobaculia bacterium]